MKRQKQTTSAVCEHPLVWVGPTAEDYKMCVVSGNVLFQNEQMNFYVFLSSIKDLKYVDVKFYFDRLLFKWFDEFIHSSNHLSLFTHIPTLLQYKFWEQYWLRNRWEKTVWGDTGTEGNLIQSTFLDVTYKTQSTDTIPHDHTNLAQIHDHTIHGNGKY